MDEMLLDDIFRRVTEARAIDAMFEYRLVDAVTESERLERLGPIADRRIEKMQKELEITMPNS